MIITPTHRERIPVSLRRRLDAVAEKWPVGTAVRHEAGWTGQVVPDFAGNPSGLGLPGQAHCLVTTSTAAVCVEATINGHITTVWYRPEVLTLAGKDAPTPRQVWPPRSRQRVRRAA